MLEEPANCLSALSEGKGTGVHSSSDADYSSISLGMFQYS